MRRVISKYWIGDRIRCNREEQDYGLYEGLGEFEDVICEVRFVEDREVEGSVRIDYVLVNTNGHVEEQYVIGIT